VNASSQSPEALSALAALGQTVTQRLGGQPGLDGVMMFVGWAEFVELDPGYDGSIFLSGAEHRERFARCYQEPDARERLMLALLGHALDSGDQHSETLAGRILLRMQTSRSDGQYMKPVFYATAEEQGTAVALMVHDRFWTDEW
jgi:hypothetical protein